MKVTVSPATGAAGCAPNAANGNAVTRTTWATSVDPPNASRSVTRTVRTPAKGWVNEAAGCVLSMTPSSLTSHA